MMVSRSTLNILCTGGGATIRAFTLLVFWALSLHAQTGFWQRMNGPWGGGSNMVAQFPDGRIVSFTGSVVYAKAPGDTVWREDSRIPGKCYLHRSDGKDIQYLSCYDKVYRSVDSGRSWTAISKIFLRFLSVSKTDGSLVGIEYPIYKLHRSTDRGETWVVADSGFRSLQEIGEGPDGMLIALGRRDSGQYNARYYCSTDRGTSWTMNRSIPDNAYLSSLTNVAPSLSLLPLKNNIYVSTDGGWEWALKGSLADTLGIQCLAYCNGTVLAGTIEGVYAFDTATWCAKLLPHSPKRIGWLTVMDTGLVYAGTPLGLYVSDDCGAAWRRGDETIPVQNLDGIAFADDGSVVVVAKYRGVYRMSANRESWQHVVQDEMGNYRCFSCGADGPLYLAGYDGRKLWQSDDGSSWLEVPVGVGNVEWLGCSQNGILYGSGWEFISTSYDRFVCMRARDGSSQRIYLPSEFSIPENVYTYPSDGMLLCDDRSFLWWSGSTWKRYRIDRPEADWFLMRGTALDRNNRLFAIASPYDFRGVPVAGGTLLSMYRSSDHACTWTPVLALGIDPKQFSDDSQGGLFIDKWNNVYFLTPYGDVYVSNDAGNHWKVFEASTEERPGFRQLTRDSEGYLWAITMRGGVRRSAYPVFPYREDEPLPAAEMDVYPSPAIGVDNISVSISLKRPCDSPLTLEIINQFGAVVSSISIPCSGLGGDMSATAPIHSLATGRYYLRLTGSGVTARKGLAVFRR